MATSFGVDPLTYVHPALQIERNEFYSDDYWTRITHYKNTLRVPGGNPWVIGDHGGSWVFFDKTTSVENAGTFKLLPTYLLDTVNYPTSSVPFDFFSIETRLIAHEGIAGPPLNTIYEPTMLGTNPGTGPRTLPGFGRDYVDDAQRAIQYVKRNAARFDVDPNRGNAFGSSAGSSCMGAAVLSRSAPFTTMPHAGRWGALHNSSLRSWVNWIGPINFDPRELAAANSGNLLGILDSDAVRQAADVAKLMLENGGTTASPRCVGISPALLIDYIGNERSTRIFSVYNSDIAGAKPYPDPHDSGQYAGLGAKCASKGMFHDGLTPSLAGDFGGDQQLFWESTLAPIYAFLVASSA